MDAANGNRSRYFPLGVDVLDGLGSSSRLLASFVVVGESSVGLSTCVNPDQQALGARCILAIRSFGWGRGGEHPRAGAGVLGFTRRRSGRYAGKMAALCVCKISAGCVEN